MHRIVRNTYWQATVVALAVHLGGTPDGLTWALALTGLQTIHCAFARRAPRALDAQVCALVLAVLALAAATAWQWLVVLQLGGLLVMLVADFCLAARLLVLLPWNRDVPLTVALVRWVLFSPPQPGSIVQHLALRAVERRAPATRAA